MLARADAGGEEIFVRTKTELIGRFTDILGLGDVPLWIYLYGQLPLALILLVSRL